MIPEHRVRHAIKLRFVSFQSICPIRPSVWGESRHKKTPQFFGTFFQVDIFWAAPEPEIRIVRFAGTIDSATHDGNR